MAAHCSLAADTGLVERVTARESCRNQRRLVLASASLPRSRPSRILATWPTRRPSRKEMMVRLGQAGHFSEQVSSTGCRELQMADEGSRLAAAAREALSRGRHGLTPQDLGTDRARARRRPARLSEPDSTLTWSISARCPPPPAATWSSMDPLPLPSAERDLAHGPAAKSGEGLLALGNPSFDGSLERRRAPVLRGPRSSCMDLASLRFEPLPASAREVRDIAALWRKAGEGEVLERTGEAANTGALRTAGPGRKVLHVAAHAFFVGDRCAQARAPPPSITRCSFSGIALAADRGRRGVGIAPPREIAALDLDGVEWAVLSGCDTGDGRLLPGEGVFGLRRAFRLAGARTVINEPVAGGRFVDPRLDDRLVATSPAPAAAEWVRAAGLSVLAQRRARGLSTHPFYWAGFIAAGDPPAGSQ